jgi:ribosome modulation factor
MPSVSERHLAYDAGKAAANRPKWTCPFEDTDPLYTSWLAGWTDGGGTARVQCQVCEGSGYMPRETNRLDEPFRRCGYCRGTGKEQK